MTTLFQKSPILKLALFATGLSGIVAEYMLSTLATYFLGDSVFQWTMIVSIMLFSMGVGSRLSQYLKGNLLLYFIGIEFFLSILVSFSTLISFFSAGHTIYIGAIIYSLSIMIGLLIGLEIPLVVRINKDFQSLRVNIASVMEKDYYGSLVGGVFFAFVGLPYLGLTYTPFLLGGINFSVAIFLLLQVRGVLSPLDFKKFILSGTSVLVLILLGLYFAKPIVLYSEQKRYKDKVIYYKQSRYQKIVLTEWKGQYWLFLNGNQQFSTLDEDKYHEPLVHPIIKLSKTPYEVLIFGGGDGCAARELLKYESIKAITLVDLDPEMTKLGQEHPILKAVNKNALNNPKVKIVNEDGFNYIQNNNDYYDIIIIDLPDPKNLEINRLYTIEFYRTCFRQLRPNGLIITQAGSPYYATKAFLCIEETMKTAGFNTVKMHNQVITLGEWGWILGSKSMAEEEMKKKLRALTFEKEETKWLNNEAMQLITSFGKDIYFPTDSPEVNSIHNPVLYQYYQKGNWETY